MTYGSTTRNNPRRRKTPPGTHRMPDGTLMTGATHNKDSKSVNPRKPPMATVKLGGETVKFKKGGLRQQLAVPEKYKFKKTELQRINRTPVGDSFRFLDKQRKMTSLMKKRITLAINLMKRK